VVPVKAGAAGPKIAWVKVNDSVDFNIAKFEKSNATETPKTGRLTGSGAHYIGTMPDGTKITYVPSGPRANGAFATRGIVKIDIPGKGINSTTAVFKTLDDLGID
jgi:hypothetical protein